jgi:virulence factor Mce-like protein
LTKPASGARRGSRGPSVFGGRQASVGLGLAVFLTIATMVIGAVGASLGSGNNSYQVRVHFPTGNGIIEGSDVFFGGVKVGTVSTLQLDQDGRAITMTVNIGKQYAPIHEGATAAIRPKSLLGEKYVAMTVGDPSRPAYKNGDLLPDSATSVNVELDQIINIFDEPTRKQLQTLIDQLGLGVAGQGRNTNETFQSGTQDLTQLAKVTDTLQARDAELKRIIESLTKLTATLSSDQQRQTYIDLLHHSDQVLKTLKDEDANVQQGIDRMNQLFGTFDAGLNGRQGDLNAVFQQLPNTVTDVDNLSVNLGRNGHIGYPVLQSSIPGIVSGPLIFGAKSSSNQFTDNIWTRVQTAVGCFYVNQRTRDASGVYTDSGGPIRTTRGDGTYTFESLPHFGPVCDSGASALLGLLGTVCGSGPPNPVTQAVCSAATGLPVPLAGAQVPASGNAGPAGTGTAAPKTISPNSLPALPPGTDQAQKDLLRYLLN